MEIKTEVQNFKITLENYYFLKIKIKIRWSTSEVVPR